MSEGETNQQIEFEYCNWRGASQLRRVIPKRIWFGESEWHSGSQWFLEALDVDKGQVRDFALMDMIFRKSF